MKLRPHLKEFMEIERIDSKYQEIYEGLKNEITLEMNNENDLELKKILKESLDLIERIHLLRGFLNSDDKKINFT